MAMYNNYVNDDDYNVTINGVDLIMEEFTPNENFNRRELSRKNIIGGTQTVVKGNYIVRDFNFTTHFIIDPNYPDAYDDMFREWLSKPVEVISRWMGGKFDAEINIKKYIDSPNYLRLEIQLTEVPEPESLIPNEDFEVPSDVINEVKKTSS